MVAQDTREAADTAADKESAEREAAERSLAADSLAAVDKESANKGWADIELLALPVGEYSWLAFALRS